MHDVLEAISGSWPFVVAVAFVGWFPVAFAFLVINSSRQFLLDRQGIVTSRLEPNAAGVVAMQERWPVLSVVLSARDEEHDIEGCLDAVLGLSWPSLEVIVVDDGSTDATPAILERFRRDHGIVVITHSEPHGKAASLDEAVEMSTGGLLLAIDADAVLTPEVALLLAAQIEHHPDVAAVTANPRVLCTDRLLQKLQAIEFSATVAAQRRSHASWGYIATMSGVCSMFRRDAFVAVGGFDPKQPAEDIELTWRLQSRGWRVTYEPTAIVGTCCPDTIGAWIRQRRRWAKGLVRAIVTNRREIARRSSFPIWPLLVESVLSVVWCHLLVLLTVFWILCAIFGAPLAGNTPLLGAWGAFVALVCTFQILWGIHLDRSNDRSITSVGLYTPLFPLFYWVMMAMATTSASIPALVRPPRTAVTWHPDRCD